MTTYADKSTTTASWPMFAAIGAGLSILLTAVGTFWDLTDNERGSHDTFAEYLPVVGVIVVATAVVFGLVVRTATPESSGKRAVVLAVLGLLSLVAFWSGLPAVLAAGAVACATLRRSRAGMVAIGISALTLGLAVLGALAG